MSGFLKFGRYRWLAVATAAAWSTTASLAVAQQAAPPPSKSYVLQYIVVLLIIALGIMIVVRPVNRSADIKIKSQD